MGNPNKMQIKYCHLLEVFKYKDQQIFCQIRLAPRRLKYHHGQLSTLKTYHWMHPENWADFEDFLQNKLDEWEVDKEIFDKTDDFCIQNGIKITIKKSRNSIRTQCRLLNERKLDEKEVTLALECSISYNNEDMERNSPENKQPVADVSTEETFEELQKYFNYEYEPQFVSKKPNGDEDDETSTSYIPYIPSSISNNSKDFNEEEYHPEPIKEEINTRKCETPLPSYKPTTINSTEKDEANVSEEIRTKDEISNEQAAAADMKHRKFKERQKSVDIKSCGDDLGMSLMYSTEDIDIETESSVLTITAERYDAVASPKSDYNIERELTEKTIDRKVSGRRMRVPRKLKYTQEIDKKETFVYKIVQNNKKKTCIKNHKTRELFGSDDDDDSAGATILSTESKKNCNEHFSISSPTLQTSQSLNKSEESNIKRKHDSNYENEKDSISKWLSKTSNREYSVLKTRGKTPRKANMSAQKKREPLTDPCENLTAFANANKRVSCTTYLSLNDLDEYELVSSLDCHKKILDELFHKLKHEPNVKINGYNGINHLLVIGLLDHSKQLAMMNKLSCVYDKLESTPRAYHDLYLNCMLPEWIVSIFMKKYKYTRSEAIARVKAQDEYRLFNDSQYASDLLL